MVGGGVTPKVDLFLRNAGRSERILSVMQRVVKLLPLVLAVCVIFSGGCLSTKGQPKGRPVAELADAWVPRPVALRIYPATRFVVEDEVATLDARVELFDAMGDATKASGLARFELFDGPSSGNPVSGGPGLLYRWDIVLTTLGDQRTYFDPVTATYAFPLKIDSLDAIKDAVYLRATLNLAEGQRLNDEQVVKTGW